MTVFDETKAILADRTVTNAYVSDEKGNPAVSVGKYAVLEMEVGPNVGIDSPLNHALKTGLNACIDSDYSYLILIKFN